MIKEKKIFLTGLILLLSALFVLGPSSEAVVGPGKIEKDLRKNDAPSQLNLEQHMANLISEFPDVLPKFLIPISTQLVLSGQHDFMKLEQAAGHTLESYFYMMFKSLPAKRFKLYDSIFFSPDSNLINWVDSLGIVLPDMSLMGRSKELSSMRLVDFEYLGADKMSLKIPKEFKEFPIFQKYLKLIGLLRLEAHIQLVEHYGGLGVLRENYPKIRLLGDLYSSFVMFEIGMKVFGALAAEYQYAEHLAGRNQSETVEWRQFQALLKGLNDGTHMMYHGIWIIAYYEELKGLEHLYQNLYFGVMGGLGERSEALLKSNQTLACGLALSGWSTDSPETRH